MFLQKSHKIVITTSTPVHRVLNECFESFEHWPPRIMRKMNLSKSGELKDAADVAPAGGRELEGAAGEHRRQELLQDALRSIE
jgi:hypothetical protein